LRVPLGENFSQIGTICNGPAGIFHAPIGRPANILPDGMDNELCLEHGFRERSPADRRVIEGLAAFLATHAKTGFN
jgi:hypothetical protein